MSIFIEQKYYYYTRFIILKKENYEKYYINMFNSKINKHVLSKNF